MSLIQLLTVGRSLGSVRDVPNRYRMSPRGLLPKFGRAAQAEAKTPAPEGGAAEAGPTETVDREKRNMIAIEEEKSTGTPPVAPPPSAHGRGRWSVKNPFLRRPPVRSDAPLQTELALESVRPVRNDLSDADLELAPARPCVPPTTPVFGAKSATRAEGGSIGVFLNRIRSRLFGRA